MHLQSSTLLFCKRCSAPRFVRRFRSPSSQQLRLEHSNSRASDEPGAIQLVVQENFRKLKAPHLLSYVYARVECRDGIRAVTKAREQIAS